MLHRVVREQLQTFLWALDQRHDERGVPLFVKREFQRFVRCGMLAHGFARFRCAGCGTDRLVAFSCKGGGLCPSCGGRRMTERAAHLIDHVLPHVPVRQWVLSLPFELRYRLAWDHELCRAVLAIYTRALLGFYRKRAKGSGHDEGRTGTVTVIQRFGGALNLNIHFHTLAVDGVFVREPNGSLSFAAAKTPTDDEVEGLLRVIRTRVLRLLVRRGLLCEEGGEALDETEPPPLHALYAASVRQRVAKSRMLTQLLNCAERLICLLSVSGKKAFVAAISFNFECQGHGISLVRLAFPNVKSARVALVLSLGPPFCL